MMVFALPAGFFILLAVLPYVAILLISLVVSAVLWLLTRAPLPTAAALVALALYIMVT